VNGAWLSAANNSLRCGPEGPYRDASSCAEERVRHLDHPSSIAERPPDDLPITRRMPGVGLDGSRRIVWMLIGMIKAHPTENQDGKASYHSANP
jgi:hypothetical protein